MWFKKDKEPEERRLDPEADWWTGQALREARIEIDKLLEHISEGSGDVEELEFRLSGAMSQLAKAWHLRGISGDDFESMSDETVGHIRYDLPNFFAWYRLVPTHLAIHELEGWEGYDE